MKILEMCITFLYDYYRVAACRAAPCGQGRYDHKPLAVADGFSHFGKRTSKNKWQSISRAAPAAKYTPHADGWHEQGVLVHAL